MAKVYFSKDVSKLINFLPKFNGKTAVKVHFGEKGNSRFVKPELIKVITDKLNDFYLTDTNTLYAGQRLNSKDHLQLAKKHGFGNFPLLINDDEVQIEINKNIFSKVKIGKTIASADSMVVVSHFKGHILFGFGGALKNIGMGCGSRGGKLEMHSKIKPSVDSSCIGCGKCIENCSVNAIKLVDGIAEINKDICTGCAKCIGVCPTRAVKIPWHGATSNEAQERCAEYAFGATKNKNCVYFNFVIDITKDCDCAADSEIIGSDVGVLFSKDPVAIDQAAYDLIVKEQGDIFLKNTSVDGTHILKYSEEIGLGCKDYELVVIE